VGFHGQTLAHDPAGRGTHQAGSGARLAQALGLPVVWDFRTADVAAGGQGAPLVPFFHHALARRMGADQPLAILNLGGVGNLTWIDPRQSDPAHPSALLAFDTGPANAPLNDLMLARLGQAQDEGGALALSGTPDPTVIAAFLRHPYFHRPSPKSLDRNAFDLLSAVQHLNTADALATLTHCAAAAVAQGARHFPAPISQLLVAGGGRHNGALMQALALHFPQVVAIDDQGLNGDMLEAQAFAYLAARVQAGLPTSSPQTTGVPRATIGGQITRP
jgi:anhydro-N-acetylmuramic acid kinase